MKILEMKIVKYWRITLDVFKSINRGKDLESDFNWRITLDVFKYVSFIAIFNFFYIEE